MAQTMNFDDIKLPPSCRLKYTRKMYYKKYIFKMVFEIDKSKLERSTVRQNYFYSRFNAYSNRVELVSALLEQLDKHVKGTDYRVRSESVRISLFTSDYDDVLALTSNVGHRLVEFERPYNDNHAEILDNFRKVVVRNSLFERDYKFKIYFKYNYKMREDRYSDVQNFLQNLDSKWAVNSTLDQFFNTKVSTRRLGYTVAVYLHNPEDLMMFQLRFHDDIEKIEEAILVSDL